MRQRSEYVPASRPLGWSCLRVLCTLRDLGRRNRKPDGERGARPEVAVDRNPALVAIDDPFHQAETEARAVRCRRPCRIDSIEAFEDVWNGMRGHADARVAHVDPGAVALARDAHAHAAALPRELHRVVEQIQKEPLEPAAITGHGDGLAD